MVSRTRTVLYVEDDELNRELMSHVAALVPGCRLELAASLAEARAVLASHGAHDVEDALADAVALVMVDLGLPDGDGADLVADVGADGPPVWAVTGDATAATAERLHRAGVARVVVKPFEIAALVATMAAALGPS